MYNGNMKKYIALTTLFGLLVLATTHAAEPSLVTKSLESLFLAKAVHLKASATIGNVSGPYMLNSTSHSTYTVDVHYDATKVGKQKAEESAMFSYDGHNNISIESKLDGSTAYIKVPGVLLTLLTQKDTKDTWVKFTQKDIDALKKKLPGIEDVYSAIKKMNANPFATVSGYREYYMPYTQALELKPAGSKTVNGKSIDMYTMTLNKTVLRNGLVAYYATKMSTQQSKSIVDSSVNAMNLRNGMFAIYSGTTRPYSMDGTLEYSSGGKVTTSIDIATTFTDYDVPIKITPPKKTISAVQAYKNWIEQGLNQAKEKGSDAATKANMANFRSTAELFYDQLGGVYGTKTNASSCNAPTKGSVFNPNTQLINTYGSSPLQIISEVQKLSKTMRCTSTTTAWAWSAKLSNGKYWCIDSNGASKEISKLHSGNSCGV